MSFLETAQAVVRGLWQTVRKVLLTLGILATIGLIAVALALPLWAFSSREPRAYTWFALALLGSGLAFLVLRSIVRRSTQQGGFAAWARLRVLPRLKTAALVLGFAAAAYAAALFFARGLVAAGLLVAVGAVVLGGWLRFAGRRGSERR